MAYYSLDFGHEATGRVVAEVLNTDGTIRNTSAGHLRSGRVVLPLHTHLKVRLTPFVDGFRYTERIITASPYQNTTRLQSSRFTKTSEVDPLAPVGGGGHAVIAEGTKMRATQPSPGVWEFVIDNTTPPAEPAPKTISIAASKFPGFTDGPGTSDTVTLYDIPGVKWRVQSPPTAVGTEYASAWFAGASSKDVSVTSGGAAEVTAIAEPGYVLSGNAAWSHNFTNTQAATKVTIPTGSYPKAVDVAGMASDKITLSKVTGVTWTVDGVDHPSSGFSGATKDVAYAKGVDTVVTAKPSSSEYEISGTASWTLQFTNATEPSGGWTNVFPTVTLAGEADATLTPGKIFGGNGTTTGLKITAGAPKVASEAIHMPTGAEQGVAILSGEDRSKLRASFVYRGGSDPWKRQVVAFMGAAGQATEVGLISTGTDQFTLADGNFLTHFQAVTLGTVIPVPVGSKVTLEWDQATNTATVLVNDVVKGTHKPATALGKVKNLMIKQSPYCTTALTVDEFSAQNWV